MNIHAEQELEFLNQRLTSIGLDAVTRIFPRKIMSASPFPVSMERLLIHSDRELQQIIDDASIPGSPLHPSVILNGSTRPTIERPEKKRKLDERTSTAKSQLEESLAMQTAWTTLAHHHHLLGLKSAELEKAYSIIKAESNAMVQLTDQALTWFLVSHCKGKDPCSNPLKSDQDSQGFREELLCELHRAQEVGINMHASIINAHRSRADLRSKIIDHPEIEDYVLALQDHDEHQVLLLQQNIRDLRNVYIVLYDLVKPVIA